MTISDPIDAARLCLALGDLRLPAIKLIWPDFAARADKEGWPAARFLAALAEHEMAERARRRIERHLEEARLPPGKTLETFEFNAVPTISRAQVVALTAGDSWLEKGANLILFGPPGGGKSHLSAAIGCALIENGWRVLFARTTDLVPIPLTLAVSAVERRESLLRRNQRWPARLPTCRTAHVSATS
jgi:DNA replication protein DnaC